MARRLIVLSIVCLFGGAIPVRAQTCLGAASLDGNPLQFGAGAGFSNSDHSVGAAFTGGHDALFGSVHAGYDTDTVVNLGAPTFGVGLGASFPTTSRVHVCALGDLTYVNGPNLGPVQSTSWITTAGGQVGIVAFERAGFQVVPTAGVAMQFAYATASGPDGRTVAVNDQYGLATFGVGLVVKRQFAVIPTIVVPFALVGGETRFGVALTYNFAR
jgi:hypothetical protein